MVFLLLFSLWYSPWMFAGIFLVISILGQWEFYSLFSSGGLSPQKTYGTVAGSLLYLSVFLPVNLSGLFPSGDLSMIPVYTALLIFFVSFIIEIFRKKNRPLENISVTVIGIIYITLPLSLLNLMNIYQTAHVFRFPAFLTGYFAFTWIYDTGAYLYGKRFGKHKFFERISPKKTWEGTIAGTVLAILAACAIGFLTGEYLLADWACLALLVIVFGTFGDLAESLIKRSLNIKDSGNILPGHGGILDRFDTVFISAPFVFLYFALRNL